MCLDTKNSGNVFQSCPYLIFFLFVCDVQIQSSSFSSYMFLAPHYTYCRFVLPVLPIALMFSGYHLSVISASTPDIKRKISPSKFGKRSLKSRLAIFFLLATNVPMALYMSMVHQVNLFLPQFPDAKVCVVSIDLIFSSYAMVKRF